MASNNARSACPKAAQAPCFVYAKLLLLESIMREQIALKQNKRVQRYRAKMKTA
ncbi:hypothetical protein BGS_0166 [Beggiatoa sp. SS]|nr:hypothetical protein BGS_0166 [Beggiatoa sp. SS]